MDDRQVVKEWCVYMVRRGDGALYTGITTEVPRRLAEHAGRRRGAKSLRGRGPLRLVLQRAVGSRELAARVEAIIKKLPRDRKEAVVATQGAIDEVIRIAAAATNSGVDR